MYPGGDPGHRNPLPVSLVWCNIRFLMRKRFLLGDNGDGESASCFFPIYYLIFMHVSQLRIKSFSPAESPEKSPFFFSCSFLVLGLMPNRKLSETRWGLAISVTNGGRCLCCNKGSKILQCPLKPEQLSREGSDWDWTSPCMLADAMFLFTEH